MSMIFFGDEVNIQDLLVKWGNGRAINDAPNDYPNQAPFVRLMGEGSIGVPPLAPEPHEFIDSHISAMKHTKPDHHRVIFGKYVYKMSDPDLGRYLQPRRSRTAARELRLSAEAYLEAKLE